MPEFIIDMTSPHKAQRAVLDNARRVNVVVCGRRWGKTDLSKRIAVDALLNGERIGLFGPQFKDIEETWQAIIKMVEPLILRKNEQMYTVDLITGGHMKFWSLKDISKKDEGRGVDYHKVIYDEYQKIPSKVLEHNWLKAVNATLIKFGGVAWFFGTVPDSRSHYAYTLVCMGAVNNPRLRAAEDIQIPKEILDKADQDFIAFRAPTSSNPLLPKDEIERMRRRLPWFVFEQEVLCKFVESGANMFLTALQLPEVSKRIFSQQNLFKKGWNMAVSFDFNRSPMAAVLIQYNDDYSAIHAVKEFGSNAGEKVTTEYTCDLIKQYLYERTGQRIGVWGKASYPCYLPLIVTGDATGRAVHGSQSDSLNYFQIVQKSLGLSEDNFVVRKANPPHASASLQMNLYLEKHERIFIDPVECARLKEDMFAARTTAEKKIDKASYDPHFLDAYRYFFHTLLPVNFAQD